MDVPATGPVEAAQIAPLSTAPAATGVSAPSDAGTPNVAAGHDVPDAKPGDETLTPVISRLFGASDDSKAAPLDVSYRVVHDPNIIVTVFTDPVTGEEIAQFPPEIIIGIAEFFDQQQGVTLDRSA
jgi:hypothetical protein